VTTSELAFLALGLLLGVAVGGALLVTIGTRPGRREIRVTVTRDAVPRRSGTLSQDAFVVGPSGPAPWGPADRRWVDREDRFRPPVAETWRPTAPPTRAAEPAPIPAPDRTLVPMTSGVVGIAIEPEADRELEDLRRRPAPGLPLERMLRGDHRAMVEVVDTVAGADSRQRRRWELLLGGLVDAMASIAVRESVIDFPMGTAFWDTFTVEQCRRIVAALSSMGFRYDGHAGWAESHVPAYRDLTQALADIGVEPRRIRAWPNQSEIANLFAGARPAPEELIAAAGPDYAAADVQALLGEHAAGLDDLWLAWDSVRPALLAEPAPEPASEPALEPALEPVLEA
jgi:hypothetical protein